MSNEAQCLCTSSSLIEICWIKSSNLKSTAIHFDRFYGIWHWLLCFCFMTNWGSLDPPTVVYKNMNNLISKFNIWLWNELRVSVLNIYLLFLPIELSRILQQWEYKERGKKVLYASSHMFILLGSRILDTISEDTNGEKNLEIWLLQRNSRIPPT